MAEICQTTPRALLVFPSENRLLRFQPEGQQPRPRE
jgi:hypothetical protein